MSSVGFLVTHKPGERGAEIDCRPIVTTRGNYDQLVPRNGDKRVFRRVGRLRVEMLAQGVGSIRIDDIPMPYDPRTLGAELRSRIEEVKGRPYSRILAGVRDEYERNLGIDNNR